MNAKMNAKFLAFVTGLILSVTSFAADLPPIVSEVIINASQKEVWRAWTTAEGLKSWLAPLAEIDLRIDGLMRTNYNASGQLGDAGTIENRILVFEPDKLLAIKVAKAPKTFPFPNAVQSMWTIIYLSEATNGQTHVRAVGLGFTDSPESARMREFFQKGNDYTLEELRKHFAK